MAIKVTFPAGENAARASGLYQWDYGQILEIESADIGTEIAEVHFACPSMSEAAVRTCSFTNGVGTVAIPDNCLEQSSLITAWVYRISGTQGYTFKTITIPITQRTRPAPGKDIPQDVTDKYTELLTEVNETVNALKNGSIVVEKAKSATSADHAVSADNAGSAGYATSAGNVEKAKSAEKAAEADSAGSATTATILEDSVSTISSENSGHATAMLSAGIYVIWDEDLHMGVLLRVNRTQETTTYTETRCLIHEVNRMGVCWFRYNPTDNTFTKWYMTEDVGDSVGELSEASSLNCSYIQLLQFPT